MLNVLAYPTDEISIRYYIAAANGAVTLTEPGKTSYPFVDRLHIIESGLKEMPRIVDRYMKNRQDLRNISRNCFELVSKKLTLEKSIATILSELSFSRSE
jgi:hypothetical protein